jgi:hypothetical protein
MAVSASDFLPLWYFRASFSLVISLLGGDQSLIAPVDEGRIYPSGLAASARCLAYAACNASIFASIYHLK